MENLAGKAHFLKYEYTKKLAALSPDTERLWGKMNLQQMIEHMSEYMRMGSGKQPQKLLTPEERLPKMQAFLMSEKPFQENTPNVLMPDTPVATHHANIQDAIAELQTEIDHFFDSFANTPDKTVINPFFGGLNYEMSVQLLHKHAWHHLKQFGITE
jgi:hypothetical protein